MSRNSDLNIYRCLRAGSIHLFLLASLIQPWNNQPKTPSLLFNTGFSCWFREHTGNLRVSVLVWGGLMRLIQAYFPNRSLWASQLIQRHAVDEQSVSSMIMNCPHLCPWAVFRQACGVSTGSYDVCLRRNPPLLLWVQWSAPVSHRYRLSSSVLFPVPCVV